MHQLAGIIKSALGINLTFSIKVYAELARRADIKNHCFTCSIDELAECLGCSRDDVDTVLVNFLDSDIIDVRMGYEESTKWTITLRIY